MHRRGNSCPPMSYFCKVHRATTNRDRHPGATERKGCVYTCNLPLFSKFFFFFKVGVAFPTLSTCHCLSVTPHLHDEGTIFCNSGWSKGNLLLVSTEIAATRTVQTRFALILKVLRVKYMLYRQDEWCCALTAV